MEESDACLFASSSRANVRLAGLPPAPLDVSYLNEPAAITCLCRRAVPVDPGRRAVDERPDVVRWQRTRQGDIAGGFKRRRPRKTVHRRPVAPDVSRLAHILEISWRRRIPTELKWKLPPGWKVGEIQWPIPLKLKEPGDIQIYGYHDEVLLMQEITPPASITDSVVKLSAEAGLARHFKKSASPAAPVCSSICQDRQLIPRRTRNFSIRFSRLLPNELPGPKSANLEWRRGDNELFLTVSSPVLENYPVADFFPSPQGDIVVGHVTLEPRSGKEITFRVPVETADKSLSSLNGLLVFGREENGNESLSLANCRDVLEKETRSAPAPARGLVTFLFFGFIGGFILNLMPCVLPVISLKIFGFVKQAGQDRRHGFFGAAWLLWPAFSPGSSDWLCC